MPGYHPAGCCQAHASTGEFGYGVQALKGNEELVGIGHVEACTIIADKKHRRAHSVRLLADGDVGIGLMRRELPGVAEQVFGVVQKVPFLGNTGAGIPAQK